jgi:hypothetical protein
MKNVARKFGRRGKPAATGGPEVDPRDLFGAPQPPRQAARPASSTPLADHLSQGWPGVDSGYVVLPRSLAEGMSLPWQQQMAALLAQFHHENARLAWPIYRVVPSRYEKLIDLDEEQLAEAGYLVEMDTEGEMIYRERSGRKIDDPANTTVLVSCLDPIPKPAQRPPASPSQVAPPAPGQPPPAPGQPPPAPAPMNIGPAPVWRTVTPPAGPSAPPLPGTPSSGAQTPPAASGAQTPPATPPPSSPAAGAPPAPAPEAQQTAAEAPTDSAQAPPALPAPPPASAPSVTPPPATGPVAPPAAPPATESAVGPGPQPVSPPSPPQGTPAPPVPEPATPPRGVPVHRGWFDELEGDLPESSKLDPPESGEFGPTGEPTEIPYRYRK